MVAVTAASRLNGVETQAVSVPVIPRVAVNVVGPTNAVPVLMTQESTIAFAGSAKTVTLCVVAAALATVVGEPVGGVMDKFVLELAMVNLAAWIVAPGFSGR